MTFRHTALGFALAALAGAPAAHAEIAYQPKIDPCGYGYVDADLDADGTVTEQEVTEASREAFAQYDADASGDITPEEFEACGNETAGQRAMTGDRTEANFAEYDTSGDEMLDQQEFMQAAENARSGASADPSDMDAQEEMRRFVFIPASQSEMNPATLTPGATAARAAILFAALDQNADAKLGPEEWAEQEALKNDVADVLNMEFSRSDTDRSGTLSPEEFEASQQRKRQEAEEMAEEAGEDTDVGAPVVYYRYDQVM